MWWFRMRRLLKSYGRDALVLLSACRDPATPLWIRAAAIGLVVYLISPIDLLPDALLPLGWLDDATLVAIGIPFLLRRLPARVRDAATNRVGRWVGRSGSGRAGAG